MVVNKIDTSDVIRKAAFSLERTQSCFDKRLLELTPHRELPAILLYVRAVGSMRQCASYYDIPFLPVVSLRT